MNSNNYVNYIGKVTNIEDIEVPQVDGDHGSAVKGALKVVVVNQYHGVDCGDEAVDDDENMYLG